MAFCDCIGLFCAHISLFCRCVVHQRRNVYVGLVCRCIRPFGGCIWLFCIYFGFFCRCVAHLRQYRTCKVICKRAQCIRKRALHNRERAQYLGKRSLCRCISAEASMQHTHTLTHTHTPTHVSAAAKCARKICHRTARRIGKLQSHEENYC